MAQTNKIKYLLVDLDDTLVTSPYSWGMTVAFPQLAERHGLAFDVQQTKRIMLGILETIDDKSNSEYLANALFHELSWPLELVNEVMSDFRSNFRPTLYDDTIPFLERCNQANIDVFLVSNNINAATIVDHLSIDTYFEKVFTPQVYKSGKPKPHLSMWYHILEYATHIQADNCLLIGNDPSTDGLFAERCGINYRLIQRNPQLGTTNGSMIQSLDDVQF